MVSRIYIWRTYFLGKNKLRNIWVTLAYSCYRFSPISNFGPLPSKNPRCAHANSASDTQNIT